MSDNSKIEWTRGDDGRPGATWNPVTGCTEVSPGCDHCYARVFAERWRGTLGHYFEHGFDVTLRPDKLGLPLRWRRPRRIFVNSMADLFHADVPDEYIARVWAVMTLASQHTFQVLTKRHGRMHALLNSADFRTAVAVGVVRAAKENPEWTPSKRPIVPTDEEREPWWPLRNVWLGVSVENQQWANLRVPALLDTPAAVRWVSAEPLLGPVDLTWCDGVNALGPDWVGGRSAGSGCPHPLLDWVVVGGESGHGARPMHPDWSRSLRDRCHRNEIPFLFKQWGEWAPIGPLYEQHDDDGEADDARMDAVTAEVMDGHRVVQLERDGSTPDGHQPGDPRTWLMARVGKKAAGRLLDGRLWDQYPTSAGQAAAATQGVTR